MPLKRPTGDALVATLEQRIGHRFADSRLLETALTHASAVKAVSNNERLEFLGDRVLGLTIAEMLYAMFPDAREGELASRFNALVDARTCGDVALELGLPALMRADAALKAGKGVRSLNYLADATEALIAAVYLDGGFEPARRLILRYWEPRAKIVVARPRNPKSELQEWAARENGGRPVYAIEDRSGPDHAPLFTVSVKIDGLAESRASGASRRAAEEAAAAALLLREGVWEHEGQDR